MRQSTRNAIALTVVGLIVALTLLRWLQLGHEQVVALATLALAGFLGVWGLRGANRGPSHHSHS